MKMIFQKLLIVFLIFIMNCTDDNNNDFKTKLSDKDIKKEFKILHEVLEETHSGLYRYTSKDEFDNLFESLYKNIKDSMTSIDFYRYITLALTEKISCGHTEIIPSHKMFSKFIPIDIYLIDKKIYINQLFDSTRAYLKAAEIISINDYTAKVIINTLRKGIPSDANSTTFKNRILELNFSEYLTSLLEHSEKYKLKIVEYGKNDTTEITLFAVAMREVSAYRKRISTANDNLLDLKFHDDQITAYMKIKTFEPRRLEKEGLNIDRFMQLSFDQIISKKIKNLIIDLRWNFGGDTDLGARLITYLYDKPFQEFYKVTAKSNHYWNLKYTDKNLLWNFETFHDHKKNNAGEYIIPGLDKYFYPKNEIFKGSIYFLVNGCTHSTSSTVAALAQYHSLGIIIGESTSGTYSGYNGGNWIWLTLPYSGIKMRIALRSFYNAIDSTHNEIIIKPDYEVNFTIEDILQNKDVVYEKAIDLIKM